MKIASWNVNSLRVRQSQVENWLLDQRPDVLVLQEIKMTDDLFPEDIYAELGYQALWSGQKTYNGVAILVQDGLMIDSDVIKAIPGFEDPQQRVLAATVDGVRIVDLYVPNGSEVGSEKYQYKLDWFAALQEWIAEERNRHEKMVILGDFNIAPADADVHNPKRWQGKILCSDLERQALEKLLSLGFVDTFRKFNTEGGQYSWWDYRSGGFARNQGLRIDLILSSLAMEGVAQDSWIDTEPRGWEQPSDHAPVIAEYL
jgi:exodeoxyribonuclease-3